MELTCLNCAGTFEVPDDGSGTGERSVQCPMCGQVQRFIAHEESPFTSHPPPPAAAPVEAMRQRAPGPEGGAFRRPMQAFSSFSRRKVVEPGKLVDDTSSQMKRIRKKSDTDRDTAIPRIEKEPSGTFESVPPDGGNGSSIWLVRSPTGLVLEFPTSSLLVNWSSIVDKPGSYTVSKGGDSWQGLGEFLDEVRQGNKGTAAFRRLARETLTGQTQGSGVHRVTMQNEAGSAVTGPGGAPPPVESDSAGDDQSGHMIAASPTSQFQFKIRESREKKARGWVVFAVVAGVIVLACGAVAALYLAGLI